MSYLSYTHIFPSFGRPLLLFPGMFTSSILLTICSSFILLTWPYHFSRCYIIFFDACTTLFVPLMCSFRILSLLVSPHIHLSILISFTSSRASCPLVVAQVSAPQFCELSLQLHWHPPVTQHSMPPGRLLSPPRVNRDT